MLREDALRKIAPFDEAFKFYFQDDDILEQLRLLGAKSARALSSKIFHLGSETTKPTGPALTYGLQTFIGKYSKDVYLRNEAAKREFWRQCGEI